jgi:hypothetical protein
MMLWVLMTTIAAAHSVVICLDPYPIVCCVSSEKRKAAAKLSISKMHGIQLDLAWSDGM